MKSWWTLLGAASAFVSTGWGAEQPQPKARVTTTVKADLRTGRLVRTVQVKAPALPPDLPHSNPVVPKATDAVAAIVEDTAAKHQVDPLLVHSVIETESNYNAYALSPKGAQGLMQLIPATAKRFGASDAFDARQNVEAGVKYLKYLKELYHDDLSLALAAYNAGEGAVKKYGQAVPPYRETQEYVRKVGRRYDSARKMSVDKPKPVTTLASSPAAPVPVETAAPAPEPTRPVEFFVGDDGRLYLRTR